ncbi:putative ribonuclease H-like domain-containing protein [Tanacetum coccineum]
MRGELFVRSKRSRRDLLPKAIHKKKGLIMMKYLLAIYVDDIIFGSTKKELCEEFEKLMKDKFQMSSMGELTFFLGLQVQQKKKGIFISQDKYVHEILKKFNYTDVKSASTPTDLERPLVKDSDADDVDEHLYRSMIGSLMYLTASRPDIMLISCSSKKQTVVATSTTEAEYVAAANCCGQAPLRYHSYYRWTLHCQSLKVQLKAVTSEVRDQEGITISQTTEIFGSNWRIKGICMLTQITKKTVGSILAVTYAAAVICLATDRKFNFSRMIFDHMVSNISSPHKFLMYPRSTSSPSPTPTSSPTPESTHTQPSPQPPTPQPSPTQPSPTHLGSEYHPPTPHDSPLHAVHSHGSDEGSLKLKRN